MSAAPVPHLRLVPVPNTGAETATTSERKLEKTKTRGVYRRGSKYVYAYRARGVQRWKTVDTYADARRGKLVSVDVPSECVTRSASIPGGVL